MADELEAYLQGLPDTLRAPIAAAIQEQAEMLSDAQRVALQSLEQDPEETGYLEASCIATPGSNDLEVIVQAGGEITTRNGYDHAEAFEFGTSHQQARPFFWPTYREKRDDIQAAINTQSKRR